MTVHKLDQQRMRIFQQFSNPVQERRRDDAIKDPVIGRERQENG